MSNIPRANGTTQACAACKYQRRKCTPDCILAPYFPHNRQKQFLNAHKLFGVSNITKIIRDLDQPQKDEAMRTIIFQSDVRASDPVGGCYRIIRELQRQFDYSKAELELVLHQLAICRAQAQAQHSPQLLMPDGSNLNYDMINADHLYSYEHANYHQQMHQESYIPMQNGQDPIKAINSWAICEDKPSPLHGNQLPSHEHGNHSRPILDVGDEKHELRFEPTHEAKKPRHEVILKEDKVIFDKESFQNAQDRDLKKAATLFTLTNRNACV